MRKLLFVSLVALMVPAVAFADEEPVNGCEAPAPDGEVKVGFFGGGDGVSCANVARPEGDMPDDSSVNYGGNEPESPNAEG